MGEIIDKLDFKDLVQLIEEDSGLIDKEAAFRIFDYEFNKEGFFEYGFDPYSCNNALMYALLFDKKGNPHMYIKRYLSSYIEMHNSDWDSDVVKLYHSLDMKFFTNNDYSTMYCWK